MKEPYVSTLIEELTLSHKRTACQHLHLQATVEPACELKIISISISKKLLVLAVSKLAVYVQIVQ